VPWLFLGGNFYHPYCLGQLGIFLLNKKSNILHAKLYTYLGSDGFIVLIKSIDVSYIYFKLEIDRPKLLGLVFFN
jgi:hypothetical protein